MKNTLIILLVALLVGCLYWVGDAVYDYFMFSHNLRILLYQEPLDFWDSLIWNVPPHDLISRGATIAACLAGGGVAAWLLERMQTAKAETQRHEQRYRTYIHNAPDAIVVIDTDGNIHDANQAMIDLVECSRDDLEARNFYDMLSEDSEKADRQPPFHLVDEQAFQGELTLKRDNQALCDVLVSMARLPDGQRIVFLRDITELRRLQQQLQQSQKLQSLGRLAGGIAHDFNNLLTGILGNAHLIQLKPDQKSDATAEQAGEIVSAASRAAELTKQLLGFARKGRQTTTPVDLHQTIAEVQSLLAHSIDRRIKIIRDLQAENPQVMGDPTQLQNALLNLGVNARDAMPDGGTLTFSTSNIHLDEAYCRSLPEPLTAGLYVVLAVTDSGEGMSPETQQQIFEPFFTTKQPGRGTGLGLASVYGTISAHKGIIQPYSQPGKGTTMKILLPCIPADVPQVAESGEETAVVTGQGRVMVVDDEEAILHYAGEALREMNYEVVTCSSGREALDILQDESDRFDLVLLDLIMPEMTGSQLFQQIRRIRPDLPVIISTGYSSREALQDTLEKGAQGLLAKPYRVDELSRIVADHIARR